jgi:uncharacterized protein YndB with AHSA1/START domain
MTDSEDKLDRAVFRVLIHGTVDDVWTELTRTDRPQGAMFNSRMETTGIEPGGQLRMRTPNGKYTSVSGRFIEVQKPVRLSHTMRFTDQDDPECTVIYQLKEVEEGVEVTLTVENIPLGTKSENNLRRGGEFITSNLKAIVETGKPTLGARMLYVLFKVMAPLTPKRCASVHWPLHQS